MSIRVDGFGVACCGNCGSQLEIVCKGGCPEPDIVFKENYIATMPTKDRKATPDHCTYGNCTDPIAPRELGSVGRPTTKCVRHLAQRRKWSPPKGAAA